VAAARRRWPRLPRAARSLRPEGTGRAGCGRGSPSSGLPALFRPFALAPARFGIGKAWAGQTPFSARKGSFGGQDDSRLPPCSQPAPLPSSPTPELGRFSPHSPVPARVPAPRSRSGSASRGCARPAAPRSTLGSVVPRGPGWGSPTGGRQGVGQVWGSHLAGRWERNLSCHCPAAVSGLGGQVTAVSAVGGSHWLVTACRKQR
jgi:hypothetical protein